MATVKAQIGKDHYSTQINTAKNSVIADEPLVNGGKESGFSPGELLAASLAACTSITLRMYADRKTWPLEKLEVDIDLSRDEEQNITNIKRSIRFYGALDAEQKQRLLDIADKCPIHKMLSNQINIQTIGI